MKYQLMQQLRPEWHLLNAVFPAKAGIQLDKTHYIHWFPACAGMTERGKSLPLELK